MPIRMFPGRSAAARWGSEGGASPAQLMLALLILATVAVVTIFAMGKAGP